MRWSHLSIEAEEQRRLPGYRDEAVVRRFDAPEALETRFYESSDPKAGHRSVLISLAAVGCLAQAGAQLGRPSMRTTGAATSVV